MSDNSACINGTTLVCPKDRGQLRRAAETMICSCCGMIFPVVNGIPVLINDEASVFAVADYTDAGGYAGASYGRMADRNVGLRRRWRALARRLGDSPSSLRFPGTRDVLDYVAQLRPRPRVLVVGSGGVRFGGPNDLVVHTDVAFGPAVDVIADAHDLPFPDGSFDLVVAVAVLEHVADPQRCVGEIWRVLSGGGHVYAITPFLQPVHMGSYDFTRFTPIGHRRLFRQFDEVAAGMAMGIGSVAAYTLTATLKSVSGRKPWLIFAGTLGLLCTPLLRGLDRWLRHGADAAGGCWFFGLRRDGAPVSDRTLVMEYRRHFGSGLATMTLPPPHAGAHPKADMA